MTSEKVLQVVDKYRSVLIGGAYTPIQYSHIHPLASRHDAYQHARFMCDEIEKFVITGRIEKAMRWLGFLQCIFWSWGHMTLAELADDNRPPDGTGT